MVPEDSSLDFFFNPLTWASFPFLSSFSHKLLGLHFFLLYVSSLLGLPFLLFRGPLALISLGLAYFFGLGSLLWAWALDLF